MKSISIRDGSLHPISVSTRQSCAFSKTGFFSNKMSFLGLGGSPSVSSQAKIEAAESELDMVTNMFNQ